MTTVHSTRYSGPDNQDSNGIIAHQQPSPLIKYHSHTTKMPPPPGPDFKDSSDKELGGLQSGSGSTTDIEAIRVPGRPESEDSDIDGIDQHHEDDSHDHEKHTVKANSNGGGRLSLVKTLSRVISRPESNFDPGPPPDGGARAWCTGMFCFPLPISILKP